MYIIEREIKKRGRGEAGKRKDINLKSFVIMAEGD
jgi:hypothetical protein